jgi:hypothetical protein
MPRGKCEATAEMWRERVVRWKQSGLTARQFAEREGIGRPTALSWWQHHLKQQKTEPNDAATLKLIRLEPVATTAKADAPIELQCGRHRVIVRPDFDDALLRRVLDVLEDER